MDLSRHLKAVLKRHHDFSQRMIDELLAVPALELVGKDDDEVATAEVVRAMAIGSLFSWIHIREGEYNRGYPDRTSEDRKGVARLAHIVSAAFWLRWDTKVIRQIHAKVGPIGRLEAELKMGMLVVDGEVARDAPPREVSELHSHRPRQTRKWP